MVSGPGPTWKGLSAGGAGVGSGAGAGAGSGSGDGVDWIGRRSVSSPLTGPRHVVPEYGTRSVLLSMICEVPERVNGQDGSPGTTAVPFTVYGTALPLIWPEAVPLPEMPFAQVTENVPAIEVGVSLVTCHEKPVQLLAAIPATGFDDHVPSIVGGAGD
jgi:hypothetical protein